VEKYLRCHVLGYCYRSFSILRKTCKALHWLLSHEECWCYGIDRELRLRIREWPPKIIELFASRFNLCFDAWPAKMPCRPKLPSRNNRLAWMFQRDGDDVFLIREEDYFAIVVPLNNVLEVAPNLRREFIIFLWFPQLGEFAISRRWILPRMLNQVRQILLFLHGPFYLRASCMNAPCTPRKLLSLIVFVARSGLILVS